MRVNVLDSKVLEVGQGPTGIPCFRFFISHTTTWRCVACLPGLFCLVYHPPPEPSLHEARKPLWLTPCSIPAPKPCLAQNRRLASLVNDSIMNAPQRENLQYFDLQYFAFLEKVSDPWVLALADNNFYLKGFCLDIFFQTTYTEVPALSLIFLKWLLLLIITFLLKRRIIRILVMALRHLEICVQHAP